MALLGPVPPRALAPPPPGLSWDVAARRLADSEHAAEYAVMALWERAQQRRRASNSRVGINRQARCGSCRKFKRGAAFCEHCGYTEGVGFAA
jgi:ribosomal protein L32